MTVAPHGNPAEAFFSTRTPSAKFDSIGTVVGGPITRISDAVQQTDFSTGAPLFWDAPNNRQPMMQLPVTVQTDLRDPQNPADTGERTLWVKGRMKKAIEDAIAVSGGHFQVGGTLHVAYVGDEPTGKGSPAKLYQAQYTPPPAGGDFFAQQQQAPAPQPAAPMPVAPPVAAQQFAQPAPQPAAPMPAAPQQAPAQPVTATMTPEQAELARSMGFAL